MNATRYRKAFVKIKQIKIHKTTKMHKRMSETGLSVLIKMPSAYTFCPLRFSSLKVEPKAFDIQLQGETKWSPKLPFQKVKIKMKINFDTCKIYVGKGENN